MYNNRYSKMNKVYVLAIARDVPAEDYRLYLDPMKTRRYGKLLKRALATALKCMHESGVSHPDAIINGTALGSWDDSEHMLRGLATEGEQVSMPTHFMLCTHNSVASMIGIYTHTQGYNSTYSHGSVSFECALMDAFLQLRSGQAQTALVCANDELTPELQQHLTRLGVNGWVAADRSLSVMLSVAPGAHPLYELTGVRIVHTKGKADSARVIYRKI